MVICSDLFFLGSTEKKNNNLVYDLLEEVNLIISCVTGAHNSNPFRV